MRRSKSTRQRKLMPLWRRTPDISGFIRIPVTGTRYYRIRRCSMAPTAPSSPGCRTPVSVGAAKRNKSSFCLLFLSRKSPRRFYPHSRRWDTARPYPQVRQSATKVLLRTCFYNKAQCGGFICILVTGRLYARIRRCGKAQQKFFLRTFLSRKSTVFQEKVRPPYRTWCLVRGLCCLIYL